MYPEESGMEKRNWLKVVIVADPRLEEPLSDFLVEILGAGVEMAAPDEPGYGTMTAWFDVADPTIVEREQLLARIEQHLLDLEKKFGISSAKISWELVQEQDWSASWKKHFLPFAITTGLVIVPSWEQYEPKEGEQLLVMDPGMAFGTGHHDTTSFSLEFIREALIEQKGRTEKRLLDVGTGTGILGMAALLFGLERVVAIDNDPDAVAAAKENIARNGMEGQMEVSLTPLAALAGEYELVVANIVHDVLVALADELVARVAPGGSLILSGILRGVQEKNIITVFTAKGFLLKKCRAGEEWVALWLKREE